MRRLLVVAAALIAVAAVAPAAGAAPSSPSKRCVQVKIGGKSVCARVGQRCSAGNRSAYLTKGLDCVLRGGRRVIAKATPAAVRQGRYIALPASGQPTKDQAFAAFEATIADIPGVSAPTGTVGSSHSGTTALQWMEAHFYELTTSQQRAVTAAVGATQPGSTIPIDENGAIIDPNAPPPAPPAETPPAEGAAVRAHAAQIAAFDQIVREAVPILAGRGVRVLHPVTVVFIPQARGNTLAQARPNWLCVGAGTNEGICAGADRAPTSCEVGIYPAIQGAALAVRRQALLHELAHCAQFEAMSSIGDLGAVPQWVLDGTAEWVAHTLSQAWSGSVPLADWWPRWLRSPEPGLFTRGYDAVGFWHLLGQKGVDVYGLMTQVVRAGLGGSAAAYARATAGVQALADDWGPTTVSLRTNPAWRLDFPYVPRPPLGSRPVTPSAGVELSFERYGASIAALRLNADIVVVQTNATTAGRLLDSSNTGFPISGTTTFCTRPGGCTCPDDPPDDTPRIRGGQAYLGLADTGGAGYATVRGQSLEEHCRRDQPDDGPGGSGGGRGRGGLELRNLDQAVIGTITTGTCSVQRGGFVARGSGSGLRFLMRIPGATRPGSYVIPIGSGSTFVQVRSGAGGFTTNRPVDGVPGAGSADLARVRVRVGGRTVTRWRISVGISPLFSSGSDDPAAVMIPTRGGLIC